MAVVQSLQPGDQIVAPKTIFWDLRNWLVKFCDNWGLGFDLFDIADPDALANAVEAGQTKVVWFATLYNPSWDFIEIAAAAKVAHGIDASLVVDSTVATPVLKQPIKHGADIIMHSATMYLNGHSDVVAGTLVRAREDELWERICQVRCNSGAILGSIEAWLLQRGMRTLYRRVRKASRRRRSRSISRGTRMSRQSSIRAYRAIPGTRSRNGRWMAGSAGRCRFG